MVGDWSQALLGPVSGSAGLLDDRCPLGFAEGGLGLGPPGAEELGLGRLGRRRLPEDLGEPVSFGPQLGDGQVA